MNAAATKVSCACSLLRVFAEDGTLATTGCVETTKRTFAPGHDARMKGFLIRAGAAGHTVRIGASGPERDAQAVADQFGFGRQVREGIERAAKREFEKTLRATVKTAEKSHEPQGKLMRNTTAKVGHATHKGQVREINDQAWFCYEDKQGNAKQTRSYTEV